MNGLCECGCGARTTVRNGRTSRYIVGHHNKGKRLTHAYPPDYEVDSETGCWLWAKSLTTDGYGRKRNPENGRIMGAHRYYWERENGPVPDGLEIDHLCRNRTCCNPEHLQPVTSAENTRRGLVPKLTPADVRAIRASALSNRQLGKIYGVNRSQISRVRSKQRWVDIEDVAA